ncbi:hypothetical protein U3516DRAFT_786345 [Neocallimastix sp. 'constans']
MKYQKLWSSILAVKALLFPLGFYDNALIEQLQFWAYLGKTAQTWVGSMTYFKSLLEVVERRRQNDKACKDLFLKIHSCDLPMM